MRLSPTPNLLSNEDSDAVLNLAQIEDLMDDDSHNPVTSGKYLHQLSSILIKLKRLFERANLRKYQTYCRIPSTLGRYTVLSY